MPPSTDPSGPSLQRLGAQLLELGHLARSVPAGAFLEQALHRVRELIAFRSGFWGLAVDVDPEGAPTIYQAQLLGLPPEFTTAWLALAAQDDYGRAIRTRRGIVHRGSDTGAELPAAVRDFDRRFGIDHAMALALEDPSTGHGFFMCLYRGKDEAPFTDDEARCFDVLVRHLLQLWRFALQDALRAGPRGEIDRVGIADRDGRLVHLGAQLFDWLCERWPGWDGRQLPQPLQLPAGVALHVAENDGYSWLLLETAESDSGAGIAVRLSPSRLRVARLFAQGQSNKEIARQLGLSPATVRTYLRDAYLQLGVRNKVELGEALDDADLKRRRDGS
jgi:DNA-binding CsgD family transcriptional regulator